MNNFIIYLKNKNLLLGQNKNRVKSWMSKLISLSYAILTM